MSNIILRALEPVDLELLYEWENKPEVWQYSDSFSPFSRHAIQQYISNTQHDIYADRQLRLMVDLVQPDGSQITIGTADLFDFDPRNMRAGVGILIFEKHFRQKGYATQALCQLMNYAFKVLHLHQLYCSVAESNEASIALFKKVGFEVTGLRKEWRKNTQLFENEIFMQVVFDKKYDSV